MGVWSVVVAGSPVDIDATYGTKTTAMIGFGMPPLQHNVTEQALIPGAMLQSIKVQPRVLQLRFAVQGATLAAYHSVRKDLLEAFKPNVGGTLAPVELRYSGAGATTVKILGYYDGGLEGNREGGARRSETLVARFLCYDPFFYQTSATNVDVAEQASIANADYVVKCVAGVWSNINTAFNGTVRAAVIDASGNIYLGGDFRNVGDANGDYIVRVAASNGAITSLGTGLNGACHCLALGPDGSLIAGGAFTSAGGVANTVRIAKWDGANWNALGTGAADNIVYALAFDFSGILYATGTFSLMGGVADTVRVAKWNGTAWSALSTGLNDAGRALAVGKDGSLYAGGAFTSAGGVADTAYIAKWNGTAWSALSTGADGAVYALAVGPDGTLYAGGEFNAMGGVAALGVAQWNGSAWSALGAIDSIVYTLHAAADGTLYAGGVLTLSGLGYGVYGSIVRYSARWNGSAWTHMPIDLPLPAPDPKAITSRDSRLVIGYDTSGTATAATQTTVANGGTAPAYPTITVARSGGTTAWLQYLRNETTGQTLYLNYRLLDGETLTITLTPGAKAITSNYFGNVIGRALLPNSDFATFCLQPGNNTVSCYVYQAGGPTVTTTVSFYAPHFGADGVAT